MTAHPALDRTEAGVRRSKLRRRSCWAFVAPTPDRSGEDGQSLSDQDRADHLDGEVVGDEIVVDGGSTEY